MSEIPRIAGWQPVRELASGTASNVYEVVAGSGTRAALKLYLPRGRDQAERGMREARASSGIVHPNLAEVLDAGVLRPGQADCQLYIVTRLIDGASLEAVLADARVLSPWRARAVAIGVARGLAAAHARGVIHRDVKPSNVVLPHGAADEAAVLIDLGLAGFIERDTGATRAGEVYGTPAYMSPEQASGVAQDTRSDVWGLGVLLHQMLYGFTPFARESMIETISAVVRAPLVLPPDGDAELNAILTKALEKDPARRFDSAVQLAEALEALRDLAEPAGTPTGMVQRTAASRAALPELPAPALIGAPSARFRLIAVITGIAALLGLFAVLVILDGYARSSQVGTLTRWWWVMPGGLALSVGLVTAQTLRLRRQRIAAVRQQLGEAQAKSARRKLVTDSLALSVEELLALSADNPQLRLVTASLALEVEQLADRTRRGDRQRAFDNVVRLLELLDRRVPQGGLLERSDKLLATAAAVVALIASVVGLRKELFAEEPATFALEGCPARVAAGERVILVPRWSRTPTPQPSGYAWYVDGELRSDAGMLRWDAPRTKGAHQLVLDALGYGRVACAVHVIGALGLRRADAPELNRTQ